MLTERATRSRRARVLGAGSSILLVLLTGCAATVPGTPWPAGQGPAPPPGAVATAPATPDAPPSSFTTPGPAPADPPAPPEPMPPREPTTTVAPVPVSPGASTGSAAPQAPRRAGTPAPAAAPAPVPPLTSDVVTDECLLGAPALTTLLGAAPAVPAANAETTRPDGSRSRACFAVGGSATVSVNVYTTNRSTPPGYVRDAAGARALTGTGDGTTAALLETVAGPTLQLGTARHLVTIAVAGRSPTDEQWRAAARAVATAPALR